MSEPLHRDLTELLRGGGAHLTLEAALEGLAPEQRSVRPANALHSVWELLEHLRIAQHDILRYTTDPGHTSPAWPDAYWPENPARVADDVWEGCLLRLEADLNEVVALVQNTPDLTAEIPHGEGRTYLRQVLLVADHNAYHLGQVVATRRALGDRP